MSAPSREEYTIGWICATSLELASAAEMLDEEYTSLPQRANDHNVYTFGRIGPHNVVIACLPAGQHGTTSAATVASQTKTAFGSLRFGLLVGIGGGVPTTQNDIRLGDVVVSQPDGQFGGVVQYDRGQRRSDGRFHRTGLLNAPPQVLLSALQKLKSNHRRGIRKHMEYLNKVSAKDIGFQRPDNVRDILFRAGYEHRGGRGCVECGADGFVARDPQDREQLVVHYGIIASGNLDIRDTETRQRLSGDLGGVLCFETEAAGLMNAFPCLVIRGICDYADSHKHDNWQGYAAATAAAFAKELLTVIPALEVTSLHTVEQIVAAEKSKPFQIIPFPRNEEVVIREEIFSELERKLPLSHRHQSAALWGLGGSGKTQIALEYAYRRYNQTSCSMFWVHADNYASFLHDYKAIANIAGLSSKLENEDLLSAVRSWIESQPNWLLILDNADALQYFGEQYASHKKISTNLYSFIPQGVNGTILWTTRDERIIGGLIGPKQGINVGRMETSEAKMLFENLSNSKVTEVDLPALAELLERLDRLPLAISQAASYIQRTSTSIQRYVDRLKKDKERWKLLGESRFDRHRRPNVPNSVMNTWQISIDHIREESPCACKILHTITYFNNQDIPFELIKAAARSRGCREDVHRKGGQGDKHDRNSDSEDDDSILEAVARLKEFSFIRHRKSENGLLSYEMHKLVQEASRYSLGKNEVETPRFSTGALEIMLQLFPRSDHNAWDRCERLLPHALAVAACPEVLEEKIDVSKLLSKVSLYLFDQGRFREKETVDLKVLQMMREMFDERHPEMIKSMAHLATTYQQQGRSKEAEDIKDKVLELRIQVLGGRHPDTIWSMASLATTYWHQGRWEKAEQIYAKVLELRRDLLGERHLETIWTMRDLASAYYQQGRSKEAEDIYTEVLQLRKEVLGERHPNTIESIANLAAIYYQQGRPKEAEDIYAEVLQLRKEVLGERHPDTIRSMADLAVIYHRQGRLKEAEDIKVEVLQLQKGVLGERHPDTIQTMANLAVTYHEQGRSKEAEDIDIEVLQLRKDVLGERHPETIWSMASLAVTYHEQGRLKEAEDVKVEVLQLRKEVLGERHPDTIWSMADLAATYHEQGRLKEAENIKVEVLQLRKEVLGERHPDTIWSMADLAAIYHRQVSRRKLRKLSH